MRLLAALFVAAIASMATLSPARADQPIDLVVHDDGATALIEATPASTPAPALLAGAPGKPTPLKIRLDATGRFELLLRVQPDLFMGRLVFAL